MGLMFAKAPFAPKAIKISVTDICCAATVTSSASLFSQMISADVHVYSDAAHRELPNEKAGKFVELRSRKVVDLEGSSTAPVEVAHSEPIGREGNAYARRIQGVGVDATSLLDCTNGETSKSVEHVWKEQVSKQKKFECELCKYQSHDHSGLRRHHGRMHKNKEMIVADFCHDCQSWELRKKQGASKRYCCEVCSLSFAKLGDFNRHIDGHQEQKWLCEPCGRRYRSKDSSRKRVNEDQENLSKPKRHQANTIIGTYKGPSNSEGGRLDTSGILQTISHPGTTQAVQPAMSSDSSSFGG